VISFMDLSSSPVRCAEIAAQSSAVRGLRKHAPCQEKAFEFDQSVAAWSGWLPEKSCALMVRWLPFSALSRSRTGFVISGGCYLRRF